MDQDTIDRLSRTLATGWNRRRLASLASAGLAVWWHGAEDLEAKKKKRKKKKKGKAAACPGGCAGNERCVGGQCVDPACGPCPAGQKCIYGLCQDPACARGGEYDFCTQDQVCCKVAGSLYRGQVPQPICSPVEYVGGDKDYHCSMLPGATSTFWPSRYACASGNSDFLPNGDKRCCIFNGFPDEGDGSLCCDRENSGQGRSVGGRCCIASGNRCQPGMDLCCNNQTCPQSAVCP